MPQVAFEGLQTDFSGSVNPQDLIVPILAPALAAVAFAKVATAIFARAIVPRSGVLRSLSVLNHTAVGETEVGVYDTGDALAGSYTLLTTAKAAQVGEGAWQAFGTAQGLAEVALTAGQHVMVALINANEGASYYLGLTTIPEVRLPAGYLSCPGGASPKLLAQHTFASKKLETITEAEMREEGNAALVIGLIK